MCILGFDFLKSCWRFNQGFMKIKTWIVHTLWKIGHRKCFCAQTALKYQIRGSPAVSIILLLFKVIKHVWRWVSPNHCQPHSSWKTRYHVLFLFLKSKSLIRSNCRNYRQVKLQIANIILKVNFISGIRILPRKTCVLNFCSSEISLKLIPTT